MTWRRAIRLAAALLLGAAGVPALADDAPGAWSFPLAPAALTPVVTFQGNPTTLAGPTADGATLRWRVEQNGTPVGRLDAVARSAGRLDLVLSAAAAGRFQFELWVGAADAKPLTVEASEPVEGTRSVYYPYDWDTAETIHGRRQSDGQDVANVAPIDLVSPGFSAGGTVYAVDTWKLTRLDLRAAGSASAVGIPKTIEVNTGYDRVTPDLPLAAGATSTLTLLAAPSIEAMSVLRFGTPRKVSGRMTFLYNKGWPCAEAACNIAAADYEVFAGHLKGAYDLAIVRSYDPSATIAQAFTRNGIAPYYYMFLGAERRTSGSRFVHEDWILKDSAGAQYGAPIVTKASSWGLYDIRRADVRAALVARAVSVLAMGYKGVFFDGPAFWLASDGHVGGAAPGATMSWTFARALLLQETRAAMTRADPDSRVGILGDRFYDGQAIADFCLKESYGENWMSIDPNPDARMLRNAAGINRRWDETYRRYTTNWLFIGQKGSNPLLIGTGLAWAQAPADRWFTEVGDAYPIDGGFSISLDRMGRILHDTSTYMRPPRGTTITALDPPGAAVLTYGPSVIGAREPTTLRLDAATPVLSIGDKTVAVTDSVRLGGGALAIVAERHDPDWSWSGYGFAFHDPATYLYGDMLLDAVPTGSTHDRLTLAVSTAPGQLSDKKRGEMRAPFTPRTITFHMPMPRGVSVTAPGGAAVAATPAPDGAGGFTLALPAKPDFGSYTIVLAYGAATPSAR